ncbi:T9SS type A sorting domain-containing protein [Flavobacterium silvaticum]|uniref:T9SS type A sorting domain-containing protein n=1 Tax=Flavobacterium silvaticum TaxID=1852020 RepID=A0A972JFY9_9FLAO|nr:T9SS type A sorting domain-containing protein [Flavobacterium silvaticum]NMH27656.1 T9SS type A sorting domain-containing protein [Flavobacterium silvaticum]
MKRMLLLLSLFVFALTSAQNFEWVAAGGVYNGSASYNMVRSVVRDSQGNMYHITESNQSAYCQGVIAENIVGSTTFIHKFNATGELQWIRRIGTNFYALNLAVDDQDNLYVLGNLYGTYDLRFEEQVFSVSAQYRNFLFKINPEGEYQWHVMTDTSGSYGACPLLVYANDHIYTQTGYTTISKLDMTGAVQATLTPDVFANYNAQDQIFFSDAEAMPNGDLVFHGCAYAAITYGTFVLTPETTSGNVPNIALRTDAFLDVQWAKMFNGVNTSGKRMSVDPDGNIYFGLRVNTFFTAGSDTVVNPDPSSTNYIDAILKTDGDGNPLWIKSVPTQAMIDGVVADPDGSGVVFGGYIEMSLSIGDFPLIYNEGRAFIAKLSSDGEFTNAFNFAAGSFGTNNHIISGADGKFIAAGHLVGGTGEFGCLEATDTFGFYLAQFTLDPIDAPTPVISQNESMLTASPEFDGTIQWYLDDELIEGATSQTLEISEAGSYSVAYSYEFGCETQTSETFLSTDAFQTNEPIRIYPNPSTGIFKLEIPSGIVAYTVSDLNGRRILSGNVNASENIDLSGTEDGIYLLQLSSENTSISKKLIKQSR